MKVFAITVTTICIIGLLFMATQSEVCKEFSWECAFKGYCEMDENDFIMVCVNAKPKFTNAEEVKGF